MLDFKHPALPNLRNDSNSYTLGSVGEHNVVIACLPMGQIGNNQAPVVVSQMLTTFPSIKFGLMVGIGAGIPPQVQLGDVVVSSPRDQYSGVVQWDFGKERQNDTFKWTGHVNNSPSVLLTAVTRLSTELAIKVPRYLDQLIDKSSKLPAEYRKSDSLKDILFNAEYAHINKDTKNGGDGQKESCKNCGMGQAKEREPRDICVHYGLIASGNKVVKDATTRDSLNRSFDRKVLCIEMEAAGVMTSCPCIVIRGICDYADSHKNKAWQEHVVAVAAVYARELLKNVSPSAVEEEPLAKETIRQGGSFSSSLCRVSITVFRNNSNIEALIPNLRALLHALNKTEVLCARLERLLGMKKERILDLKINISKTRKRQVKARGYATSRKYIQLMRELRRTEKEEEGLWKRLNKAKATQHRLRKQVAKARQSAREMSDRLLARSQSAATLEGRQDRSNPKFASSTKAHIYIVSSRKRVQSTSAYGLHSIWRW